ncbi:MAG: hypothetical protein ACRDRL_15210 [Sciscionella sp.]
MSAGAGFDIHDLNRLAATLAHGAQDLEGLAAQAPPLPDAGSSSGAVGEGIAALAGVMSKITQTAAAASDRVQASVESYAHTDQQNSENLHGLRGSH